MLFDPLLVIRQAFAPSIQCGYNILDLSENDTYRADEKELYKLLTPL